MNYLKSIVGFIVAALFFLVVPVQINAQETSYSVDYVFRFTPDAGRNLRVELDINLKNARPELYINEFSLTFPKNFLAGDIIAEDVNGRIAYTQKDIATGQKITFTFSEPEQQKAEHFFTLKYTLNELFSQQGFVKEAILPLIQYDPNSKVTVELYLPLGFDDKISLSKPIPTVVEDSKIVWEDVRVRTIYAIFGQSQIYKAKLNYNLENKNIFKGTQRIALPPDTLYQRVFINSLDPKPDNVLLDEDGNYLAEYTLDAREKKKIVFDSYIEVFTRPQESMRPHIKNLFEKQQQYLLTDQQLWSVGGYVNNSKIQSLDSVKDIYGFVVNELSYSFDKISKDNRRLGASEVLKRPSLAVCTEFTDLFIGLAREKGIYAREIEGYGYSTKQSIRPLSLVTDVLHAWPEFYEPAQNIWIQVDPTWEDTSGIDYFSGLDVNHIVFAIHGKSTTEPLPAGFYKTEASKDIDISISSVRPEEKSHIAISTILPSKIPSSHYSEMDITVTNTGNSSIHALTLNPKSQFLTFDNPIIDLGFVAPYQTKTLKVKVKASNQGKESDTLTLFYNGSEVYATKVHIDTSDEPSGILYIIGGGVLLLLLAGFVIFKR